MAPREASSTPVKPDGKQCGRRQSSKGNLSAHKSPVNPEKHDPSKRDSLPKQPAHQMPQDELRPPSKTTAPIDLTQSDPFQLGIPKNCVRLDLRLAESTSDALNLDSKQHLYGVVNGDATPQRLQQIIHQGLIKYLEEQMDANEVLAGVDELRVAIAVWTSVDRGNVLDVDDPEYAGRAATISDLFTSSLTSESRLNVVVKLDQINFEADRSPQQPEQSAGPVQISDLLRPALEPDSYWYVRVGDSAPPTKIKSNAEEIAAEYPLIAEVNPRMKEVNCLWHTEAWDFGDDCIGGLQWHKQEEDFNPHLHWWGAFKKTTSMRQLAQRIFRNGNVHPRFPFLPPLTFQPFESTAAGEGFVPVGNLDRGYEVQVAVHLVSHLDAAGVELARNIQFGLDDDDTAATVEAWLEPKLKAIRKELRSKGKEDELRCEFWVLPHRPALQKMHRLPTDETHATRFLKGFLNESLLADGFLKLYMEAHLFPLE